MLTNEDKEFFGAISDNFKELAKLALYECRSRANSIINGFIDNENDIGLILDGMLSFCNDDEILKLYKAVLRSVFYKYPELVHDYVYAYLEMFEPEKVEDKKI